MSQQNAQNRARRRIWRMQVQQGYGSQKRAEPANQSVQRPHETAQTLAGVR